ncbi:MAG: CBS domain-containing protein [Candidatus Hydrogenedentes bacterium]|nr:CBS domain-containing protein [Candidatus Hydrogenedentota bacterium]
MPIVGDIIKPRDIYWVSANDTIRQTVHYICERKTGAVVVKEGESVAGIFSERDLMHRVVNESLDIDLVTVREVMSPDPLSVNLEDKMSHAKALMFKSGVRHLVVVGKGDVFKGLISMRDLIEADMAESSELIEKLNDGYYEAAYRSRWRVSSNRVIVEHYQQQP